jgi:hypothetical protein
LEGVIIMAADMRDPVLEALLRRLFDHTHELFNEDTTRRPLLVRC